MLVGEHGELAYAFFMSDLALGREPREHGAQSRLDRLRSQYRHQQPHRHQSVAAKIRVETPGTCQQLFAVAQEGQSISGSCVVVLPPVQQGRARERGQGHLAAQRGDTQVDSFVDTRGDLSVRPQGAISHLERQAVAGCAIEPAARPGKRVWRRLRAHDDFLGEASRRLIVTQNTDAREDRLPRFEALGAYGSFEGDPIERPTGRVARRRCRRYRGDDPLRRRTARRLKPDPNTTVTRGKRDQEAGGLT